MSRIQEPSPDSGKFMGHPEIPATEIESAAKENDISPTTLKRAKIAGGYISKRVETQNGDHEWIWQKKTESAMLERHNNENEQQNGRGKLKKNAKWIAMLRHIFRTYWTYWSSCLTKMVKWFNKS
jgi:hypothetical protein